MICFYTDQAHRLTNEMSMINTIMEVWRLKKIKNENEKKEEKKDSSSKVRLLLQKFCGYLFLRIARITTFCGYLFLQIRKNLYQ